MASTRYLQTSFAAGVLDPRLKGRMDIKQYYQGMSVGQNVVTLPLGGVKRRPGTQYLDTIPNVLTARQAAATATAPNGGTANNARDDDTSTVVTTTTPIGTTNPYVVVHYDLGSAQTIRFADAIGISLSEGSSADFQVQYSTDNVSWTGFTTMASVTTTPRDFRNNAAAVSARYWRVARIGAADLGAAVVTLKDFLLWEESSTPSEAQIVTYKLTDSFDFDFVLTDRSISVYQAGGVGGPAWNIPGPWESADLAEVDAHDSYTEVVFVHEDYPPFRLITTLEQIPTWAEPIIFSAVPQYDYNDDNSPTPTSAIYAIAFNGGSWAAGHTFQIEIDGARTGAIAYAGAGTADERNATADNIARAVQKLYTVGFGGVSCAYNAGTTWDLTLAEDSANDYPLPVGIPVSGNSANAIVVTETQAGSPRSEDVWSATRGWPRTVAFHAGRLWFGGTRSLPQARFGSVVYDFYNFEPGEGLDDDAVFDAPFDAAKIVGIFSTRVLQIFTERAELRQARGVITPENFNPEKQTHYGSAQIRPVSIDGSTLFMQRSGKVLRDFLFTLDEDDYSSSPVSVLAQHLLNSAVDIAAYQGSGDDEANYVYVVNGDGTMAVYNTLRSQEIAAWSQWTTDGLYKAVGVSDERRSVIVRRTLNGVSVNCYELMDEDHRLDCAIAYSGAKVSIITGLDHLDGEECRVRAGNIILDNETPSGGTITAHQDEAVFSSTTFEVGLDWTPTVTTMPLNGDFGPGGNFLRKKRVVKARLLVHDVLGLKYNGRILPDAHWNFGGGEVAPESASGLLTIEESSNWDEGPLTQTITQEDPLPFHLLALDIEMESA